MSEMVKTGSRGLAAGPRRVIGRPSCHFRCNAPKAQFAQIKLIDKDIDRPDRIVLAQIVIQPLGKQRALTRPSPITKRVIESLPPKSQENHIIDGVFTQPGSDADGSPSLSGVRSSPYTGHSARPLFTAPHPDASKRKAKARAVL